MTVQPANFRLTSTTLIEHLKNVWLISGIKGDPSENIAIKYENDPVYRYVFERCVRTIAPVDADAILSVGMQSLKSYTTESNTNLLAAISCVEDEYGREYKGTISYRDDRFIDFDAILRSFPTDVDALEYWKLLEQCGGPSAPDIDPANFGLQRECLEHEHGGEEPHFHGNC